MSQVLDDASATAIAKTLMREENVDNLTGFGDITMGRIEKMLVKAAQVAYIAGYSTGVMEGQA